MNKDVGKYKDLNSLDLQELNSKIYNLKKELFSFRVQKALGGGLVNLSLFRKHRRTIARIKTVLSDRKNKIK